ncbi:hypothetical protein [Thiolapillus sp.]|uniref:hypothetical protein n=1 Tax=Thiolapillus sp. TaxID=2017437 RepID=UPI003AF5D0CF
MFSLWRKARRENSAASRLLGTTSLRFALHGWQRKVRGIVHSGDFILASGHEDGTARAVRPDALDEAAGSRIVGRAWPSSSESGIHKVMVAVGLDLGDAAVLQANKLKSMVEQQQTLLSELKSITQRQRGRIAALELTLSRYEYLAAELQQIKSQLGEKQTVVLR